MRPALECARVSYYNARLSSPRPQPARALNAKTKFRKTKVIATIGPACDDDATLRGMIAAGMNVARLNMSHASVDAHAKTLRRLREAARARDATLAVMVDTRGREIRIGKLKGGKLLLERGGKFSLFDNGNGKEGDERGISTTHPELAPHLSKGDRILIDDGQIELIVASARRGEIACHVECGGLLRDSKSINFPGNTAVYDCLAPDDSRELEFAAEHEVEYIAASFIRNASDITALKAQLKKLGANIPVIAKIEDRHGVDNLADIIAASNGIMVARGDLGVELEMGEGPTIQKRIIRATVSGGKPVITATQMLDSMERNPRPTRAEVSDVANAIFDGTSAVMLSGETAAGSRPVEAVQTMVDLALDAETGLRQYGYLQQIHPSPSNEVTEAVAQAAITMANHLNAAAILALTETGLTSRMISKYRPESPILAVTSSQRVVRQLAMNWGVQAIHYENAGGSDADKLQFAMARAAKLGYVRRGDLVILTAGSSHQAGSTNLIRVLTAG
ncbi:MAG: pyruvate kinase [Gammaproteobacteria bacterium]|nr:pyruvate kinase [Gammaproteobacteria bacterium]